MGPICPMGPMIAPNPSPESSRSTLGVAESVRRRGLLFVGMAVALASFALAIQVGLNANFLYEEIHVTGLRIGLLEMVRESCGIVAFAVLALLAGFPEPRVGSAMLVLLAVGLGSYAFVPSYGWVMATSVIWSQGLHVWMPLPNSMTLSLAEPGRAGFRLGQITAAASVGFGAGILVAFGLAELGVRMRPMYLVAGSAAALAAAACFGIPRGIKTPGPRLVVRRRYRLYYLLCFLDGCRKQIFLCFAGFLLVSVHGVKLRSQLLLWVTCQVIGYFGSPRVGRLIDRIGERRILTFYFTCVTGVFLGYAFVPSRDVLFAFFIADSAFSMCGTALPTYVNRIAPSSEHTPTLSMGVAMNHIGAVTMPLVGGLLWRYHYRWTFLVGALAAALSILAARRVPRHGALPSQYGKPE